MQVSDFDSEAPKALSQVKNPKLCKEGGGGGVVAIIVLHDALERRRSLKPSQKRPPPPPWGTPETWAHLPKHLGFPSVFREGAK